MQGFSWARANLITLWKCVSPNGVSNLQFPALVIFTSASNDTCSTAAVDATSITKQSSKHAEVKMPNSELRSYRGVLQVPSIRFAGML